MKAWRGGASAGGRGRPVRKHRGRGTGGRPAQGCVVHRVKSHRTEERQTPQELLSQLTRTEDSKILSFRRAGIIY